MPQRSAARVTLPVSIDARMILIVTQFGGRHAAKLPNVPTGNYDPGAGGAEGRLRQGVVPRSVLQGVVGEAKQAAAEPEGAAGQDSRPPPVFASIEGEE